MKPDANGYDNNSLKFVRDAPRQETTDVFEATNESLVASGLTRQQHHVYYPLLAHNSYQPDNSQLILTNLADKTKLSQVI